MNGWKEIAAEYSSGPNPTQMHICVHSGVGGRDEIPDMFAGQLGPCRMCCFFESFAFSELFNNYNFK